MKLIDLFVKATPQPMARDRVVGIDIGSSAIKVVELEDRDGVVTLMTYGEIQTGSYQEGKAIGQTVVLEPAEERQALIDVLRESSVKARKAILSIPLSASFVTTMSLTAAKDEDISTRVRVEARKYIPVPIADVTLDWAELGAADDTTRDVLLAAIQNDALKRFMTLMQAADLPVPPTEIECFSALRAVYDTSVPSIAIIDIGAQTSKLYIGRDGLLQRMHRIPTGGAKLTDRLATDLGVSFADAEVMKRSPATAADGGTAIQKATVSTFERVFREFKQVLDDYEGHTGQVIEQIILTGGTASSATVVSMIKSEFGKDVQYAHPFDRVAYPAFMEDTLRAIGPTFVPALGAALRMFE
jgi:type IV pilus assembly protein PilM